MSNRKNFALACVLGSVLLAVIGACSSNSGDGGGSGGTGGAGSGTKPCPVANDPCYQQLTAEYENAKSCYYHPSTCATSGNKDASGCGTYNSSQTSCTYPDGSRWQLVPGTPIVSHIYGPSGQECYRFDGLTKLTFANGKSFSLTYANGAYAIVCPDGSSVALPNPVADYSCGLYPLEGECCVGADGKCS